MNLVLNKTPVGTLVTDWTGKHRYTKLQGPVYGIDSADSTVNAARTAVGTTTRIAVYGDYIEYICRTGGETASSYSISCSYGGSVPRSWILVGGRAASSGGGTSLTWDVLDQVNYNITNTVCPYTSPNNNPWTSDARGTIYEGIASPGNYSAYRLIITTVSLQGPAHVSAFQLYT